MEDWFVKPSDRSKFWLDLLYPSIVNGYGHEPTMCELGLTCRGLRSPLNLSAGINPNVNNGLTIVCKMVGTDLYNAACVGMVFSSTTASGWRLGGVLAAVAAPRSTMFFYTSIIICHYRQ